MNPAPGEKVVSASTLDPTSRALLIAQIGTLALYGLLLGPASDLPGEEHISTTLTILSDACVVVACLYAASCPGAEKYKKAWRWFAAAYAGFVLGSLGWFVPSIAEQAQRGLSLIDLAYFLFFPLVLLGVLAWPRRAERATRRVSDWVDALTLPVGAGMAVWFGLAEAAATSMRTNPGGDGGALFYPFADLLLLLAVALLTRDPPDEFARLACRLIALSLFVSTIGDIGLALSLIRDTRGKVEWPDVVYVAASLIMTLSALFFRFEAVNQAPLSMRLRSRFARMPRLTFLLPAAGAGLGFLFLVYDALSLRDIRGAGLAIGASLLVVLGVVRAVLSETEAAQNAAQLSAALERLRETQATAELARESAERALRAKGEFFAVMGHEIRTPLNAVIGMTQILLKTTLSPTQRESAEVIRQGGDALLAVVNDLLDFSKMEAGRLEIESLPLNPGRTIERLATLMQTTAKTRELTIEVTLGNLPRVALGDEARLGQILLNLLSNAIKFSHGGVIRVKADATQVGSNFELTVSVIDPGLGIPRDRLQMLFKPFAQLSPGRTRNYGGTGLGLVICKRLTEMMGGWIQVESEPGLGSTFTFRVLLGLADQFSTVPIPALVPGLPSRREDLGPLSVLVIEDNVVNQLVVRAMVEALGHKVTVVDGGVEALQDVRNNAYDVILTDLMMPDMDGVETAQRLRELDNGRTALIVALTAAATVEDRERCLAAGMDGFLAKPFTLEALRSLFARFG